MKITYKLLDGNLTYDVSEVVMGLNFVFNSDGTVDRAQIVRRRYFSISGTPVKEDSAPATYRSIVDLRDVILSPTALSLDQILTAINLSLLASEPELISQKDVVLPTLPADVGALVQAAQLELEHVNSNLESTKVHQAEIEQNLVIAQGLLAEKNAALTNLREELTSVTKEKEQDYLGMKAQLEELEAGIAAKQATISTLDESIREKSEESTVLQMKIQAQKSEATTN